MMSFASSGSASATAMYRDTMFSVDAIADVDIFASFNSKLVLETLLFNKGDGENSPMWIFGIGTSQKLDV
jgi:hypothetical protein